MILSETKTQCANKVMFFLHLKRSKVPKAWETGLDPRKVGEGQEGNEGDEGNEVMQLQLYYESL